MNKLKNNFKHICGHSVNGNMAEYIDLEKRMEHNIKKKILKPF
jgi:hypothetical protein